MPRLIAALGATAVLLAAPLASANIEAGEYRGKFRDKGNAIGVALTLLPARYAGDPAGRIRLRAPWNCDFGLRFAGANGQLSNYNLGCAGIGACKAMAGGVLRVHPSGRGIQIEVFGADGNMVRKIGLSKQA